jgi:hypothetical protein
MQEDPPVPGSSSLTHQLHGFTLARSHHLSAENCFEDMGTVAGTPHAVATEDNDIDIERMDLRDSKQHGRGKGKGPKCLCSD